VTRGVDSRALASGRIAAVGRATQAALGEMGLTPDLIPDLVPCESHGIGLAQGLLALLEKGSATRILYPRAHQGREDAVARLVDAGCDVNLVSAYRSIARDGSEPALVDALGKLRAGALHAVAFFAPSQFHALCTMGEDVLALLGEVPVLAAIGPTTAAALRSAGLEAHAVARSPSSEDMAEAIAEAFLALTPA
ncbi:MAG: uroporphyrinogen-III synthase, partial [Myxococcales bacterium]|nr:uroporphyrinogen-III synthase [Myxococcales bacterium]